MRPRAILLSTFLSLLVAATARPDVVELTDGRRIQGTLEGVSFRAEGETSWRARAVLRAVRLEGGDRDRLELVDGTAEVGQVLSVKIETVDGALSFTRKDLKAVLINRDLHAVNKALYEKYKDRIQEKEEQGLAELKKKHGGRWEQLKLELRKLAGQIRLREDRWEGEKERLRRKYRMAGYSGNQIENMLKAAFMAHEKKVNGLRERALQLRAELATLKSVIEEEKADVARDADEKRRLAREAYYKHQRLIAEGSGLRTEGMIEAFEQAVGGD